MSKGEIIRHLGEGQYQVRQALAVESITAEIERLKLRNDELAVLIPEMRLERLEVNDLGESLARDIDLLLPQLMAGEEGVRGQIAGLQSELVKVRSRLAELDWKIGLLVAENLSKLKRRNMLESVPESRELTVWCADYSVSLEGEVGLIDINDEGGQGVLIKPGFDTDAVFDPGEDGALYPDLAQSGPQIFFNAALLPGVQKWLPRYRVGEIRSIRGDVCTVDLDDARSSAQNLAINKTQTLSNVPIVYMECNGSAFADGDRVVVRYTEHGPLVVGFEKEPHQCAGGLIFRPSRLDFSSASGYQGAVRKDYGAPYLDEEGEEIEYPLGTEGEFDAWMATASSAGFRVQRGAGLNYGTANWVGRNGDVLSWTAPPGRVHRNVEVDSDLTFFSNLKQGWGLGPFICYRQSLIDLEIGPILGAAIYRDPSGKAWLRAVNVNHELYRAPVNESREVTGPAEFVAAYSVVRFSKAITGWYFSDDGRQAVCTFVLTTDVSDDGFEKRYVARFNGVSFSDQLVYDQSDVIGQRFRRVYSTRNGTPPDPYSYDLGEESNYSRQPYAIPIYYDFVGAEEVAVNLYFGAETFAESYNKAGTFIVGDEENDTAHSSLLDGSSIIIATSGNQVIASFEGSRREVVESSSFQSASSGGAFTATHQENTRSLSMVIQFIDARHKACIARMQKLERQRSGAGPVSRESDEFQISGQGAESFESTEVFYLSGAAVAESVIEEYQLSYSDLVLSDQNVGQLSGLPAENQDNQTTTDLHKVSLSINQSEIFSAMAYVSAESSFATAGVIVSDSEARRLFYKSGPEDTIDSALALGDDVFLMEPGRI